jgi:hypothetical protein
VSSATIQTERSTVSYDPSVEADYQELLLVFLYDRRVSFLWDSYHITLAVGCSMDEECRNSAMRCPRCHTTNYLRMVKSCVYKIDQTFAANLSRKKRQKRANVTCNDNYRCFHCWCEEVEDLLKGTDVDRQFLKIALLLLSMMSEPEIPRFRPTEMLISPFPCRQHCTEESAVADMSLILDIINCDFCTSYLPRADGFCLSNILVATMDCSGNYQPISFTHQQAWIEYSKFAQNAMTTYDNDPGEEAKEELESIIQRRNLSFENEFWTILEATPGGMRQRHRLGISDFRCGDMLFGVCQLQGIGLGYLDSSGRIKFHVPLQQNEGMAIVRYIFYRDGKNLRVGLPIKITHFVFLGFSRPIPDQNHTLMIQNGKIITQEAQHALDFPSKGSASSASSASRTVDEPSQHQNVSLKLQGQAQERLPEVISTTIPRRDLPAEDQDFELEEDSASCHSSDDQSSPAKETRKYVGSTAIHQEASTPSDSNSEGTISPPAKKYKTSVSDTRGRASEEKKLPQALKPLEASQTSSHVKQTTPVRRSPRFQQLDLPIAKSTTLEHPKENSTTQDSTLAETQNNTNQQARGGKGLGKGGSFRATNPNKQNSCWSYADLDDVEVDHASMSPTSYGNPSNATIALHFGARWLDLPGFEEINFNNAHHACKRFASEQNICVLLSWSRNKTEMKACLRKMQNASKLLIFCHGAFGDEQVRLESGLLTARMNKHMETMQAVTVDELMDICPSTRYGFIFCDTRRNLH